jgi:3-deoxy-manno-octulosonate cytidylyltransferase (CMP-KDO synthetase)
MDSEFVVIVPARLGSTRLVAKPLEYIGPKMMIQHVVDNMLLALPYPIYVATDSEKIAATLKDRPVEVIMTSENCPSGSDRVHEALTRIINRSAAEPQMNINAVQKIKYVINIQGDMPFIAPSVIKTIAARLQSSQADVVTCAVKVDEKIASKASNVKLVMDKNQNALYFSRSMIPHGASEFLYHVGVYGFQVEALQNFVQMPASNYEKCEKLEQLRILENGQKIAIAIVDDIPISVDTPEDLAFARAYYDRHFKS